MTQSRASRTVAERGSATMSVRGVITSPARVSPNSMMDWMSSPSSSSRMPSSSPTSMSACMSPPLSSSSSSSASAPACVTCGSPPRALGHHLPRRDDEREHAVEGAVERQEREQRPLGVRRREQARDDLPEEQRQRQRDEE